MCTPGTLVSVRGTQAAKSSRWAFASVARVSVSAVSRRVLLEFGSERACAPPALSATRTHTYLVGSGASCSP